MREVVAFLRQLHAHNDRVWFDENRAEYQRVKALFHAFVGELIDAVASFDPSIAGLRVCDCTYRINRDTRFSPDKSPYKTYMGAYLAPHGKKSGYAGYYFHVEPVDEEGNPWQSQLTAGLYMPEPVVLRSIRDEIFDNGAEVAAAIRRAEGFRLFRGNQLKRTPKGYPAGSQYDDLLRMKDLFLQQNIDDEFLCGTHLLERTVAEFRKTKPFVDLLNRAVQYAHEEMM